MRGRLFPAITRCLFTVHLLFVYRLIARVRSYVRLHVCVGVIGRLVTVRARTQYNVKLICNFKHNAQLSRILILILSTAQAI